MKKWQIALLWTALCLILMIPYSIVQTLTEDGILPKWSFAMTDITIFIVGWMYVFFRIKTLKNKQDAKKKLIRGFADIMIIWSIFMGSDMIAYFVNNNITNKWYFLAVGVVYIFIGWISARLDTIIPKTKDKK